MKHLFIINPASGGKSHNPAVTEEMIKKAVRDIKDDYEIYFTKGPKDAITKINEDAEVCDDLRVYCCGGDGTLCEGVNAAVGKKNVAITSFPCGTGNDFVKTFGADAEKFKSIKALINGEVHTVDTIKCNDTACINICSVGADARIGTDVHKYSKLPLIKGHIAYVVSTVVNIVKGISSQMTIKWDGNILDGKFTMVSACNGRFYGGGFNPTGEAHIEDGIMDVLIVKDVPFAKVPPAILKYAKGRYYDLPEYITYIRTNRIEISAPEEFVVNVDGEAVYTERVVFELKTDSLRFISPKGVKYWDEIKKNEEFASVAE